MSNNEVNTGTAKRAEDVGYRQRMNAYHKLTDRHVLVLEASVTEAQKRKLLHTSNLIRIAGNDLVSVMKANLEQIFRTKRYRNLQELYKKAKESENKKDISRIVSQMQEMQEAYHLTKDFCCKTMDKIKDDYNINSIFARAKAEDIWQAVEKCLYGNGKTIHFKKYGEYPEIRAKQIERGITMYPFKDDEGNDALSLRVMKMEFNLIINRPKHKTRTGHVIDSTEASHDRFAEEEAEAILHYMENPEVIDKAALNLYEKNGMLMDTYRPCYVSLVIKEIRGKMRIYAHITVEGRAKKKYNRDGSSRYSYGKGFVGCDIGTQSIAYTSKKEVNLKNLAERGDSIQKRERKEKLLLRKMDRSRRAVNPENYNEDGTIRKGKKTWKKSRRYQKLQKRYRNISRIAAENRRLAINQDVNHIRSLGNVFITEPKNAKQLQKRAKKTERQDKLSVVKNADGMEKTVRKYKRKKRFGKSIKNRCPGYFQARVKSKFESTGGVYVEVNKDYRASQYDHTCNDYIKKKLSDRMFLLSDGTRVQRDWYSSFLLYCIGVDLSRISRYKCSRYFNDMYDKYLQLETYIIDNNIKVMNSGIKLKAA